MLSAAKMMSPLRRSMLAKGNSLAGQSRLMSGHTPEQALAEMEKWKKFSYICIPVVTVAGVVIVATTKHEHHELVEYPYLRKRDKPMPWTLKGGSKCDLFDFECAAKERAAKAELAE
mmetsp:Transcript_38220/g.83996  ORF Transcript_38220/g.83996 Transcript_38220/m.83996 type:complete len:117 (+) Transcript_38220:162-512(+)